VIAVGADGVIVGAKVEPVGVLAPDQCRCIREYDLVDVDVAEISNSAIVENLKLGLLALELRYIPASPFHAIRAIPGRGAHNGPIDEQVHPRLVGVISA